MSGAQPTQPDAEANRQLWTRVNARYADEHAWRAWAAEEITWGIFDMPERELRVLGAVDGLDVVELGCGTAYFSAWLAKRGARPVGVDLTAAQLSTAHRCQETFRIRFPLIQADAEGLPFRPGRFDLAVSECGASLWCDPVQWVAEAARVLRPGGRLVFHTTSLLLGLCLPPEGPAGLKLLHPQRAVHRLQPAGGGVQFHPAHGTWIQILRAAGFLVEALHELYAPPDASNHPYYQLATAEWAQQWPVEEIWEARLAA
jgi:SAM-dependent methyltransferase